MRNLKQSQLMAPKEACRDFDFPFLRDVVCISVAAVTAAGGSALTAGHFRKACTDRTHAEPKRGTKWWGKSVLLTFALFKSEPL
ncbi:hypothetical protein C1C98_16585 [Pseudomonas ogarae]|uniref:Uncharacterized protein n=1 Tax=Pseudomonas ogarae (strain DSM 112162 / CECT 30235 / F113) TaxID=1114970 RepID=A0ABN5G8S0_PSEO1|nr:hypothetical protein C1C98_16585 [Pseudomonas ogarae]